MKPIRQHMDQEAADELLGRQGHRLLALLLSTRLPWCC
jgi:hypothetical protein